MRLLTQPGNQLGQGDRSRESAMGTCEAASPGEEKMHPEGFEPPTPGSEDRCSIRLSYGCDRSPRSRCSAAPRNSVLLQGEFPAAAEDAAVQPHSPGWLGECRSTESGTSLRD